MKRDELLEAVKRVESEGLVPAGQGEKVGARLVEILFPPRDATRTAAAVVGWLGGILVAAGLLLFIAAHWEELGKVAKLTLIFGTLAGLHYAGYRLAESPGRRPALGEALTAAAMLLFGGAIGLVAQIYNLSSHYPKAILVWWLLNVPFALLSRSRRLLVIPLALFVVWLHMHVDVWVEDQLRARHFLWSESEVLAFGFVELGLGALLAALAAVCRAGRYETFSAPLALLGRFAALAGLFTLAFKELGSTRLVSPEQGQLFSTERMGELWIVLAPVACVAGTALVVALLALARRPARGAMRHELADGAAAIGAAVAVAATLLVVPGGAFLAANGAMLAAVLALVMRGTHRGRPADVNLAVVAFLATVMARYFEYVADEFGAVFVFIGAGVLLIALGGALERKRRSWVARAAGSKP